MLSVARLHFGCFRQFTHRETSGRKWFDCAECHQEQADHELLQTFDMVHTSMLHLNCDLCDAKGNQAFACKKCKKCFRKDTKEFEER